jgi:hypothetical protein
MTNDGMGNAGNVDSLELSTSPAFPHPGMTRIRTGT